jgi:hypothetical protein
MAGRPRWWVAGLSLFLALVVGVVVWMTQRDSTYHAPLSGPGPAQASPAQAATLLRGLETAVGRDDPPSAHRLGSSAGAAAALSAVVRNGQALHVTGFSLRYVDEVGGVAPDGAFAAYAQASWRFAGFDQRAESMEVRVRFAQRGGHLRIAGIGGGDRRSPLWLSGPVQVRRSPGTLVLVQGDAAEADRVAGLARTAVPQVRRVLPGWTPHLVVEVPATEQRLEAALHADQGQYAGIAAVTTSVDGDRARNAPVHVFVNPQAFLPLKPDGAQVVLTHEATHVATSAATSPSPIWLVEGFADYVALRSQHLPLTTTAARISSLVHSAGVPRHLPGEHEFAAGAPHLEARYESAWLACRLLADSAGPRALVSFYRAVDAGHPVGAALRTHVGFGLRGLTERWRTLLAHLPA